jgi:hypothetical protein
LIMHDSRVTRETIQGAADVGRPERPSSSL